MVCLVQCLEQSLEQDSLCWPEEAQEPTEHARAARTQLSVRGPMGRLQSVSLGHPV